MKFNILRSIEKYLKSIDGLDMLIYRDSSFDLTQTYSIHSKIDLPLGTETSFILVDNDDDTDLKGFDDTDYLLHRYIKFVSPSSTQDNKSILIESFNNTTGEITMSEAFGEAVETTDIFNLDILDAIFINNGTNFQSYMKRNATEERVPIYLHLQTKEDGDREKMFDYAFLLKSNLIKDRKRLPIYNESDVVCGYMKIIGNIDDTTKIDNDNHIITSLFNFTVSYTMNYGI